MSVLGVINTELDPWVSYTISIAALDGDIVVPICGSDESGRESLCYAAIRLERKRKGHWYPAEIKVKSRVIGGIAVDKWIPATIRASNVGTFSFGYPNGLFAVSRGQRLRLAIDTWQNVDAMRNRVSAKKADFGRIHYPLTRTFLHRRITSVNVVTT